MCTNHSLGSLYVHKQCLILTAYPSSSCQWPSSSNYTARQISKKFGTRVLYKKLTPKLKFHEGVQQGMLTEGCKWQFAHIINIFVWYGLNSKDVHKILCYPYPAYSVVFDKSPNTRTQ